MTGFNTESINKGHQGLQNATVQSHVFTTDSIVFESWGLSSFTGPSLNEFCRLDNFSSMFGNLDTLDGSTVPQGLGKRVTAFNSVLDNNGQDLDRPQDSYLNISVWRNKERNGEWTKIEKLSDWKFTDEEGLIGAAGKVYDWKDLELDDILRTFPDLTDSSEEVDQKAGEVLEDRQKIFAVRMYELNNYVNGLGQYDTLEPVDKIRVEFLTDIRSSKERCINWKATIKYNNPVVVSNDKPPEAEEEGDQQTQNNFDPVPPAPLPVDNNQPLDQVNSAQATSVRIEYTDAKEHEFELKLYLFSDEDGEVDDSRSVCLKNLNFTGPRSTYDFGSFLEMEDGEITELLANNNPNNDVAAHLDLSYVDYLAKWESGSPQMLAVISEDVPAAKSPSIDDIESQTTQILLSPDRGQEVTSGYAIPIHMQNGNPKQWGPSYNKVEGERPETDYEKSKIKVHNISDNGYARGDIVILNRIEGLWFPIKSVGGVTVPKQLEHADPQWEFMYLMTSADFHFKNIWAENITPQGYEKGFYREYYETFANVAENVETQNKNKNVERYSRAFKRSSAVANEYFQHSSFAHSSEYYEALSHTIYGEYLDGEFYGDTEVDVTSPFFGCVFPGGYNASAWVDKNTAGAERDYEVKSPGDFGEFEQIDPGYHKYFKNFSADNKSRYEQSCYARWEQGDLKHLPADIATNAGPFSKWGRPIQNVRDFGYSNYYRTFDKNEFSENGDNVTYDTYKRCAHFLSKPSVFGGEPLLDTRGTYLFEYKPSGDYSTDYFNLQPNNFLKLQFRPCSREFYACVLDAYTWNGPGGFSDGIYWPEAFNFTRNTNSVGSEFINTYGYTSKINKDHLTSGVQGELGSHGYPAGLIVKPKFLNPETNQFEGGDGATLKFSTMLLYDQPFSSDPEFDSPDYKTLYTNLPAGVTDQDDGYPAFWWDQYWMRDGNVTKQPAGGIGIIGAAATVASKDKIELSTDNVLGLGDYLVVFNPAEWASTIKNGNYDSQLTTALYARVYQHHPRNLTWYDPRFMVVHHFNEGDGRDGLGYDLNLDGIIDPKTRHIIEYKSKNPSQEIFNSPYEDDLDYFKTVQYPKFANYFTHEQGAIYFDQYDGSVTDALADTDNFPDGENYDPAASGYFIVERAEYGVDFRVPTDWDGNNIGLGGKVYSDSTENLRSKLIAGVALPPNTLEKIRQPEHWNVNTNRRSKLLPYSFRYKTIGISKRVSAVTKENKDSILTDNTFIPHNYNLVIVDGGKGYSVGDKFEVVGGAGFGTVFTVKTVRDTMGPSDEYPQGEILELEIASDDDQGMQYSPEDFIPILVENGDEYNFNILEWSDDVTPSSKLTLVPLTGTEVSGEGLEAFVLTGSIVLTAELMDPKPSEALDVTGPIKLSMNIPRNDINRNQGQTKGQFANSFNIVKPHAEHKYDIFLRYHNDISHVGARIPSDAPLPFEQHVTLDIGVNLGSNDGVSSTDQLMQMLNDQLGGTSNAVDFLLDENNFNDGFHTDNEDTASSQASSYLNLDTGDGQGGIPLGGQFSR